MILLDTGPMVALFDRDDNHHSRCQKALAKIKEPLITTWAVLTEVLYLLSFSFKAQDLCLEWIEKGGTEIDAPTSKKISRIHVLMKQYQDVPMDFADASLVALAEQEKLSVIFTLDHHDFCIYRPNVRQSFTLIPSHLS